ncbi:MAG: hypothetical protein NVS3B6_15980 [Pseudarthrobacter sp.]
MSDGTVVTSALIREGLEKLQAETFAEGGSGFGADEVVSTSVIQQGMARRYENVLRDGTWGFCDGFIDFSHELMDAWLLDVRSSLYVPGRGTYKTYRVHLFPDADGWLEVFDEEILTKGIFGRPEDGESSGERSGRPVRTEGLSPYVGQHSPMDVGRPPCRRHYPAGLQP